MASACQGNSSPGSSLRAGATSEWPTTLPRPIPCRSLMSATSGMSDAICSSGNGAIAEFVAGIDDLDPDARRIDVGHAPPARLARVPGALVLVDQAVDRSRLHRSDNGRRPSLRAMSAGRARLRRPAFRCNAARSSRPAAAARRSWAKGVDEIQVHAPMAHGYGCCGQAPVAGAICPQRAFRPGCRRRSGGKGRGH